MATASLMSMLYLGTVLLLGSYCFASGTDNSDEPPRSPIWGAGLIEEELEVDVLVAGGGSAGTAAAVAAARNGAKVVLVNGRSVLGGNSGSEIRVEMIGACGPRAGEQNALKMECREGGVVEEYLLSNAAINTKRVPEFFSLELLNIIKAEPNIILMQNTWLVNVTVEKGQNGGPNRITSAMCENQESQRRYVIRAKNYIDSTGDGRLGAEAGAEWIQGRESPQQYNESLAIGPDHETEGTTIIYHLADTGKPVPFTAPVWAAKLNASQFQYRPLSATTGGYWWTEVSYPYNTITDNENITAELLTDMFGIWDYIKNSGKYPKSENYMIDWFGYVGGKREGRRFVGQFVATQNDILKDPSASIAQAPTMYWDRIGHAGWAFDLHNPKGFRDPSHPPFNHTTTPYMYSTALGSLISKDLTNLFFAGRLASFSHVVYGSQRVMKSCAVTGQAAGTAAAYSIVKGIDPINIRDNKDDVWSIQQQLLRDDHFIIGMYNEDPRDLARFSDVSATTELSTNDTDGKAINVISGQSRAVVGHRGVAPGQGKNGTNRWISQGLPASISLSLPEQTTVAQVQIVFDSGMHRKLQNVYMNTPGSDSAPPPELARDYTIEGLTASGDWVTLCNVTDNYQRRRVHNLPCPKVEPTPLPPPPPGPVAGSVFAQTCNPQSSTQKWTYANGQFSTFISPNNKVCLGVNRTAIAFGGETQAVVAVPCDIVWPSEWEFKPSDGGSFLSIPQADTLNCTIRGDPMACACAHITACATCHTQTIYPGAAIELWPCNQDSHDVKWSLLQLVGSKNPTEPSGLLMAGGLCLDTNGAPGLTTEAATPPPSRKSVIVASVPDTSSPPPEVKSIRVTVASTNGIPDAHINEIRLYDVDGVAPFPTKSGRG